MSEHLLRRFHAAHPGATSAALGRAGSYERVAACVPPDARVLDLACGDGHLLRLLPPGALGVDLSLDELRLAHDLPVVQARAQQLPFADARFDAITCHLAFMLFDDIAQVVAELARVLTHGGCFVALLGGGPIADGDDAFHRFLELVRPRLVDPPRFGDRRASTEAGWAQLFADGWSAPTFTRLELVLHDPDDVWRFLASSYQTAGLPLDDIRATLAAEARPCRIATYLATVTRR